MRLSVGSWCPVTAASCVPGPLPVGTRWPAVRGVVTASCGLQLPTRTRQARSGRSSHVSRGEARVTLRIEDTVTIVGHKGRATSRPPERLLRGGKETWKRASAAGPVGAWSPPARNRVAVPERQREPAWAGPAPLRAGTRRHRKQVPTQTPCRTVPSSSRKAGTAPRPLDGGQPEEAGPDRGGHPGPPAVGRGLALRAAEEEQTEGHTV